MYLIDPRFLLVHRSVPHPFKDCISFHCFDKHQFINCLYPLLMGCLQFFAVMNTAAVNNLVHTSFHICAVVSVE